MAETSDRSVAQNSNAGPGLRVLIAEDEVLISLFLADVLTDLGHQVVGTASSVAEALALAAQQAADLAMIDLSLADGGDGLDAARQLLQQHGIPSVIMTGSSHADMAARAASAKPLAYVTKPYTEADVVRALNEARPQLQSR